MKKSPAKIIKRIIAALLVLSLAFGIFTACNRATASADTYRIKSKNIVESAKADVGFHTYSTDNELFVCKSGLIELYFDKSSFSISVKDTAAGAVWYSLPLAANADSEASVLNAVLSDKNGNIYNFNSQDNSVAFESASFEPITDGISVTYKLAQTAETASYDFTQLNKNTPAAEITVKYTLKDGSLFTEIEHNSVLVPNGITLESVSLLDFLSSTPSCKSGDFIFVPDGCGALIKPDVKDAENTSYTIPVYGNDISVCEEKSNAEAIVPAFGMKQGNASFVALVESGDTVASIDAVRGSDETKSGRVFASFAMTDIYYKAKKNSSFTVYRGMETNDDIRICYRFLSGNNATYSGFATACRELLIRNTVLSTSTVKTSEYYPVFLSIDAATVKKAGSTNYTALTTFEEATDMLTQMKAKGINNIFVRYASVFSGADLQYDAANVKILNALGSKEEYTELYNFVNTQQMEIYLDVSVLSSVKSSKGFDNNDTAKTVAGKNTVINQKKAFSEITSDKETKTAFLEINGLDKKVSAVLRATKSLPLTGYSVNDFGSVLYSDYSNSLSRKELASEITKANSVLATERKLIVKKGNFNCLKAADIIYCLPSTTGNKTSDSFVAIPFVELVLHGIADYTFEPINTSTDTDAAFLKCMEYGALPSFEWYYTDTESAELDAIYKYENSLSVASDLYTRASVMNSTRSSRISSHTVLQDGVYLTEYSNGVKVYVNYNDKPLEVNDIYIDAKCFVKVG